MPASARVGVSETRAASGPTFHRPGPAAPATPGLSPTPSHWAAISSPTPRSLLPVWSRSFRRRRSGFFYPSKERREINVQLGKYTPVSSDFLAIEFHKFLLPFFV